MSRNANKPLKLSQTPGMITKSVILHLVMIAFGFVMLVPLLWTLATALTPNTKIPPTALFPPLSTITFDNFIQSWTLIGDTTGITMGRFLLNSVIVTAGITISGLIVASLAAYVLALKDFPLKKVFVFLALSTLMIPSQVTLVPSFLICFKGSAAFTNFCVDIFATKLGWLKADTCKNICGAITAYGTQIIPFVASGLGISLFRSHFMSVSKEIEESAKIDGARNFHIYSGIVMPIAKPVIGTMTILKVMWSWNMYLWPLIAVREPQYRPLPIALDYFKGRNFNDWGYLCAAMTIVLLPMIIVFICCQRQFIGGLQAGAVKG